MPHRAVSAVLAALALGLCAPALAAADTGLSGGVRREGGRDEWRTGDRERPDRRDQREMRESERDEKDPPRGPQRYTLEQAMSDRAQLSTMGFNGLAFLTGDFAQDTFFPPGKLADYFGFQYLRDGDVREGGHQGRFLTRIAFNVMAVLDSRQLSRLMILGADQQDKLKRFAEMRLPLMMAFRRNLSGDIPTGSKGLDKAAVLRYSADLYALDGEISYERARVMGDILHQLTPAQRAALGRLKFGDSATWPEKSETSAPYDRRSVSHEVDVAMMTYAADMFSWYAGSVDADTYFCPERHASYFGAFGLKTAPAMGRPQYAISTSLTGDSGEAFVALLSDTQRQLVYDVLAQQRGDLAEIARTRQMIAAELRRFLKGEVADQARVISLSRRYGELDGAIAYRQAQLFATLGKSLTGPQRTALSRLRPSTTDAPRGPFLYAEPVRQLPVENSDFLFGMSRRAASLSMNRWSW